MVTPPRSEPHPPTAHLPATPAPPSTVGENPLTPPMSAARPRGRWRSRLRQCGLLFAAFLPMPLKRFVYRWGFGYRISRTARIGIAYLDCARLTIGDHAQIAHGNVFLRCGDVTIGNHVRIGPLNLLHGGERIVLDDYAEIRRLNFISAIHDHDCTNQPDSSFYLGYGAVVTAEEHYIHGGLGSIVAQVLGKHQPVPLEMVALDRYAESGKPEQLLEKYGLTPRDVEAAVRRVLKRKGARP